VSKELELLLEAQDDDSEFEKEEQTRKLVKIKKNLKMVCKHAVTESVKAYKLFHSFIVSKAQTQWDKIVHGMHSKDPWVGVNGKSHKGLCMHS
jgi:hypothetical protein